MATSFRVAVIRQVTNALRKTFDSDYPDELLRNIYVGPEFQYDRGKYPAVIIQFQPSITRNVGMGHYLVDVDEDGLDRTYRQFYFEGTITFTVFSLSSYERDLLLDHLLDVIAFGRYNPATDEFWNEVFSDDFIILNMMTDNPHPGNVGTAQVPWDTENEQFYTGTLFVDVSGHFYQDAETTDMVPINQIDVYPYRSADQPTPQGAEPPWN